MAAALSELELIASGKVREIYELGDDRLLLVAGDDADAGWQVGGRADALRSPPEGGMAVRGDPRRVATGALGHAASLARALPVDASPC